MQTERFEDLGLLLTGDALEGLRALPSGCAYACVTSPPYFGLRDYGVEGQLSIPHFATFPAELIRPCILAGSPPGGAVLDPFFGSGTTGLVALEEGRRFIGAELNPKYTALASKRLHEAIDRGLQTKVFSV